MADKIVKNSDLEHVQEKLVNEIETMLLSDPLIHALTGKGIQRFVSGITHAFGIFNGIHGREVKYYE